MLFVEVISIPPIALIQINDQLSSAAPAIASAIDGDFASGGVIALMYARKLATARTFLSNVGIRRGVGACRGFSPSAVVRGVAPERHGRAVRLRREHPDVGLDQLETERPRA